MKPPWRTMTVGDWLVVLLLLGLSVAGLVLVATAPVGSRVIVTCEGSTVFTASLDQPQSVDLKGPLGETRLVIDTEGAHITSSPCPRKICLTMGPANDTADLIACVPNRILVRIDGSNENKEASYDLLSR